MSNMPAKLDLICRPIVPKRREPFRIRVESTSDVDDLKLAINQREPTISSVDVNLFKVSIPINKDLEEALDRLDLDHMEPLYPFAKLSSIFPDQPAEDHLHVVIRPFPLEGPPPKRPRFSADDVQLLNGHEGNRWHQIVFNLREALWKKMDAWATITRDSEVTVPDITLNEAAEEPFKASFVDLTDILDWDPLQDSAWFGLCPRFLVREEYIEFDKYLYNPDNHHHVLLVGQPGIGKTVYLTYCLLRRLIDGKPTIFALSPDFRYLFLDSGVYWIPNNSFLLAKHLDLVRRYLDNLALFDLNHEQPTPIAFRTWGSLVTSSPKGSRFKEWVKQMNVKMFFMKTWSWSEIYVAKYAKEPCELHQLHAMFVKYGGSPRTLFSMADTHIEEDILRAINNCIDLIQLFRDSYYGFEDEVSHLLIEVNPRIDENGVEWRGISDSQITSRYIFDKLLQEKKENLVGSIQSVFRMLFRNPSTRSASGMMFERAGHRYLFASLASPLHIRSLSNSESISLDLRHVTRIKNFASDEIRSFDKLDYTLYYQPLSSTVAGIDSFVLEVDGNTPTAVVLFQFTTSLHHPTNPAFLPKLWIPHQRSDRSVKWKLVYVVPREIEADYAAQPWKPASLGETWKSRVEQYVWGVDEPKLWDEMRSGRMSHSLI